MSYTDMYIMIVVQAVIISLLCLDLAKEKGYPWTKMLYGLFLSVIGLLYVIGLPDKYARPSLYQQEYIDSYDEYDGQQDNG